MVNRTLKTVESVDDQEGITLSELESGNEIDEHIPDDIAFQNLVSEFGLSDQNGKVNVYKLEAGKFRDQTFLFDCLPSEFALPMLQDPDFHLDGYHKFQVILRSAGGIVKSKTVSVLPSKAFKRENSEIAQSNNQLSEIAQLIKAMSEQTNALILSLSQKPIEKQKSTMDFLQELALMRDVMGMGNNSQPVQPQQSPLEMIRLAKELASEMSPDTDGGGMWKVLERYADPVLAAIKEAQAVKLQVKTPVQSIPDNPHGITPAQPNISVAPVITHVNESEPNMSMMLKMYINQLVGQAARNADVDLYADLILDQVGDDIYQHIEPPDWFEKLKAIEPTVAPYEKWFTNLRASLLTEDALEGETLTNTKNDDINDITEQLDNIPNEFDNTD